MLTEILNLVREILKRLTGVAALEQKIDALRSDIKNLSDALLGLPGDRQASEELVATASRAENVAIGAIQLEERLKEVEGE